MDCFIEACYTGKVEALNQDNLEAKVSEEWRLFPITWFGAPNCGYNGRYWNWGNMRFHEQRISSLFTAQKYCLRVLFGDRLAYLDKFKTCARTRPIGQQKLDQKCFIKEHTKPIFKHNNISAIQNL